MNAIEANQDKIREFNEKGYTVVNSILPLDRIPKYIDALEKAIKSQDLYWSSNQYYTDRNMVHNPMIYNSIFMEVLRNKTILSYLQAALDPHCILYAFTTSSIPPSSATEAGENFATRIHVDCPRLIKDYITNIGFFIPLTDLTIENGATFYLPGSFQRVDQPSKEEFFSNAEQPLIKAGDAVLLNARVWHSAGQNTTATYRHALTMNVCRSFMRQRFDYPRLLGEDLLETEEEDVLKFLGYRVRTPVTLDEYYLPPEDRLYYPGQE